MKVSLQQDCGILASSEHGDECDPSLTTFASNSFISALTFSAFQANNNSNLQMYCKEVLYF